MILNTSKLLLSTFFRRKFLDSLNEFSRFFCLTNFIMVFFQLLGLGLCAWDLFIIHSMQPTQAARSHTHTHTHSRKLTTTTSQSQSQSQFQSLSQSQSTATALRLRFPPFGSSFYYYYYILLLFSLLRFTRSFYLYASTCIFVCYFYALLRPPILALILILLPDSDSDSDLLSGRCDGRRGTMSRCPAEWIRGISAHLSP